MLPFLLPLALGTVSGGAASIPKAANDAKPQNKQLVCIKQSAKRKVLYLKPYEGYGL